jgi:hypothetical protein
MMTQIQGRRLWLHLGLSKTGSSFIQTVLHAHRDVLLGQGYLYPQTGIFGGAHKLLAVPFLSDERKTFADVTPHLKNDPDQLFLRLEQEFRQSGAEKVVLSSEYFAEAEDLSRLKEALGRLALPVTIVVYLRRQDRWIEAGYNQAVKAGLEARKLVLGSQYSERHDFEAFLDRWARVFGLEAIVVRTFEQAVERHGILKSFLEVLGAQLPDEEEVSGDRNERLDARLLEFRRIENAIGLSHSTLAQIANARVSALGGGRESGLLAPEERRRFLECYAESNARVARRYLKRPDGVLFEPPSDGMIPNVSDADAQLGLSVVVSSGFDALFSEIKELKAELELLRSEVRSLRER